MSVWKKIVLVNGGWVIGVVISLFVVPPSTPLWLWTTVSGLVLAVLNYLFFGRQRRATDGRKIGLMTSVAGGLGVLVLVLELIFRYVHR